MDVALDQVDTKLDGGAEGRERVFWALIRISAMTPEQNAAASKLRREALGMRDRHRPMLRELSRPFYIRGHAQEISHAAVTSAAALARASPRSYDPTQEPLAGATTAGASAGGRPAGAVPGAGAAAPLHAGDGEGARRRGAGAGRNQFQPPSRYLDGAGLP